MNAMLCKKCGSPMKIMASGKGFRCDVPGNRWQNGRWTICDYVFFPQKKADHFTPRTITRAADFPRIIKPTAEQTAIFEALSKSPASRGSRLIITNAGAGTGKTQTMASGTAFVYHRRGRLDDFPLCAFNRNARDVLENRTPLAVQCFTMNGLGARAQGYTARQYKSAKFRNVFKSLVEAIPYKERPAMGIGFQMLERMLDNLMYCADASSQLWRTYINAILTRFPGLVKKYTMNSETINQYLPLVATIGHSDNKTISIGEQITRPVTLAVERLKWEMPEELCTVGAEWSDSHVKHFAALIRAISIPGQGGLILDEAQDLSLSQIALFLSMVWRSGELVIIGDDKNGEPGESDYKAGQAIFGWRGAFGGSMKLIARLWKELTGETSVELPLSITFRCPPEICEAIRPLNTSLKSAKPRGNYRLAYASFEVAFQHFTELEAGKTALWISRTNATLAPIFLETLKSRKAVCLRGGGEMEGKIDGALYPIAGYYNATGEYPVSLSECVKGLRAAVAEQDDSEPDSIESFLLAIGEEIEKNPSILKEAELQPVASVGNLKRFILYFADKAAPRVLSTVYRCKGDEADVVIVSDCEKLNEAWNGDSDEAAACRFVAATRTKHTLLLLGHLSGVNVERDAGSVGVPDESEAKAPARKRRAKPVKVEENDGDE